MPVDMGACNKDKADETADTPRRTETKDQDEPEKAGGHDEEMNARSRPKTTTRIMLIFVRSIAKHATQDPNNQIVLRTMTSCP